MLWRWPAYAGPGLPSPTTSQTWSASVTAVVLCSDEGSDEDHSAAAASASVASDSSWTMPASASAASRSAST